MRLLSIRLDASKRGEFRSQLIQLGIIIRQSSRVGSFWYPLVPSGSFWIPLDPSGSFRFLDAGEQLIATGKTSLGKHQPLCSTLYATAPPLLLSFSPSLLLFFSPPPSSLYLSISLFLSFFLHSIKYSSTKRPICKPN